MEKILKFLSWEAVPQHSVSLDFSELPGIWYDMAAKEDSSWHQKTILPGGGRSLKSIATQYKDPVVFRMDSRHLQEVDLSEEYKSGVFAVFQQRHQAYGSFKALEEAVRKLNCAFNGDVYTVDIYCTPYSFHALSPEPKKKICTSDQIFGLEFCKQQANEMMQKVAAETTGRTWRFNASRTAAIECYALTMEPVPGGRVVELC